MSFQQDKKKSKEKVLINLEEESNSDELKEITPNRWEKVIKSEQASRKIMSLPVQQQQTQSLVVTQPVSVIIRDELEQARIAEQEKAFLARMNKRNADKKLAEELKTYFRHFNFLQKEILLKIKEQMNNYIFKCQKLNTKGRNNYPLRFQNRQKLLKICLLCRGQMQSKKITPINAIEKYLLKAGSDSFKFILSHVESTEEHLFCRLYDSFAIHSGKYPSQFKSFLMHMDDQVNFDFRRSFLNKTMKLTYIAETSSQEMTTDEEKVRNLKKMRKIINQSTDVAKHLKATYQREEEEAEKRRNNPNYVPYTPIVENQEHKKERLKQLKIYYERAAAVKEKLKASRRNMRVRIEKIEGDKGKKLMKAFRQALPMID